MKKLSELRDDEALEVLSELVEPAVEIVKDKELIRLIQEKQFPKAVSLAIGGHKVEVMKIMAALEQVPYEDYHIGLFTLPTNLLKLMNDPELLDFFALQAQMDSDTSSGPATENIAEDGQ